MKEKRRRPNKVVWVGGETSRGRGGVKEDQWSGSTEEEGGSRDVEEEET